MKAEWIQIRAIEKRLRIARELIWQMADAYRALSLHQMPVLSVIRQALATADIVEVNKRKLVACLITPDQHRQLLVWANDPTGNAAVAEAAASSADDDVRHLRAENQQLTLRNKILRAKLREIERRIRDLRVEASE